MNRYIKPSTGLIIIFAVAVLLGGGALTYFWVKSPSDFDYLGAQSVLHKTKTKTPAPVATAPADPTEDWNTYTDSDYGLSFKYPKTWEKPVKEDGVAADSMIGIGSRYLPFQKNTDGNYKSVTLTKYSDYAGTNLASSLEKIKTAFNDQSAAGTEKLMLPIENAGVMAASVPQYLATSDKKWRGIYYFANIGQAQSTDITCVIIMTDGEDKVVQYTMSANSDKAADYDVNEDENSAFITYVNDLDVKTSIEEVVKDFNSTYKLMAQSLKSL